MLCELFWTHNPLHVRTSQVATLCWRKRTLSWAALIAMAALETMPERNQGLSTPLQKECGRLGQPYEKRTINRKRCQIPQKKIEHKNPMVKIWISHYQNVCIFVIVICAILPARFSTFSAAVTIYRPNPFSIYLAQEISRARYINQSHFRYI